MYLLITPSAQLEAHSNRSRVEPIKKGPFVTLVSELEYTMFGVVCVKSDICT